MSKYNGLIGRKILVVEDVELNQYLARHIMESWGCMVEIAENGKIAVDSISQQDYDLVLMDIQMPVMDGMEATKRIRKMTDHYKSTIPIIALTANALKSECETYLSIGMNDWLAKPFEEPALYKKIITNIIKKELAVNSDPAPVMEAVREAQPAEMKLYNLAMVESISGGDKEFIQRMLNLFLETVPGTLNEIRNSTDKGDWLMLSKQAHKLKSTIDSMGIVELKNDIRAIETGAKDGMDPETLKALVNKVISVMGLVRDQVKTEVG